MVKRATPGAFCYVGVVRAANLSSVQLTKNLSHRPTLSAPQDVHPLRALMCLQNSPTSHAGFYEVGRYIDRLAGGHVAFADVDGLLHRLLAQSAPLERGVVGPTGASSTISFSVLGPVFGLYGFYAGCQIIGRAGDARAYLHQVEKEIAKRQTELMALKKLQTHGTTLTASLADLQARLGALQSFHKGVHQSLHEQAFNQTFPGVVQLGASILILTLAAEMSPTIGSGHAVLSSTGTAALGASAAGVLGVYAAGSFVKNAVDLTRALRTHRMTVHTSDSDLVKRYIADYNTSVTIHRAFYGLNTASWGVYVGGSVALVLIGSGVVLSHGSAVGAVVVGALAAVVWDAVWGRRCAPHNALTPHIDRNYINTFQRRIDAWEVLQRQRQNIDITTRCVLTGLPNSTHLSNEMRYKYFWQFIPKLGGTQRVGRWAQESLAAVDKPIHLYMATTTQHEMVYLRSKLACRAQNLVERHRELGQAAVRQEMKELRALWSADLTQFGDECTRLTAMQGLHNELSRIDVAKVRTCPAEGVRWNRARLGFLSVHGLFAMFIRPKDLKKNPNWYCFDTRKTRAIRRERFTHVRLSAKGYDALSHEGLETSLERRFVSTLLSAQVNRYELAALRKMEHHEHRGRAAHKAAENARSVSAQAMVSRSW